MPISSKFPFFVCNQHVPVRLQSLFPGSRGAVAAVFSGQKLYHGWLGHVYLTVHRSPRLCGNLEALEDLDVSFKAQSIYLLGVCRFLKSVSICPKIFLNIFLPFLSFHPLVSSASSSPSSFLAAQPTLIWV